MPRTIVKGYSKKLQIIGECPEHGAWWQTIDPRSVRPLLSGASVPGHGAHVRRPTYPRRKISRGICGMA